LAGRHACAAHGLWRGSVTGGGVLGGQGLDLAHQLLAEFFDVLGDVVIGVGRATPVPSRLARK